MFNKTPVDFVKCDRHMEMLKLVSAMHKFPVRDEKFAEIVEHYAAVTTEIDVHQITHSLISIVLPNKYT